MSRFNKLCVLTILFSSFALNLAQLTTDDIQGENTTNQPDVAIEEYLASIIETDDLIPKNEEEDKKENYSIEEPIVVKKAYCEGCSVDLNVANPDLQEFVDQALIFLNKKLKGSYKLGLLKLRKAQRELVNGIKYTLSMDIGDTDCLKESNKNENQCKVSENSIPIPCTIEFFEKPGLPIRRDIVASTCNQIDNNDLNNEVVAKSYINSVSEHQSQPGIEVESSFDSLSDINVADDAERIFLEFAGTGFAVLNKNSDDKTIKNTFSSGTTNYDITNIPEVAEDDIGIEIVRMRRAANVGLIGDFKKIGYEDKEFVDDLSDVAVKTLDDIDEDNLRRIVLKVVNAEKQIADGVMYRLTLIVGTTSCNENGPLNSECLKDSTLSQKLCTVHLHRSFVNNSPRVQVVKSECTPEAKEPEVEKQKIRSKRHIPGGISPANVSDPDVQKASTFALSEINNRLDSEYKLVKIKVAGTQVVAGLKTYLTLEVTPCSHTESGASGCNPQSSETRECTAEVFEQAWLNKIELVRFSCEPAVQRTKREAHPIPGKGVLVGAPSQADLDDPYIKELATFSLAHLDRKSNALYKHMIVKILSAEQQVVAGTLINLKMEVGYSTCRKGSNQAAEECTLKADSNNQICNVEIWDRPWLNDRQVTKINCSPLSQSRRRRGIVGGASDVDVNNSAVKEIADFGLKTVNERSNSVYKHVITRIIKAQRQVVQGSLYILELEVGTSNCHKSNSTDSENCTLNQDENKQICKVKIWDRPWLNDRRVTELSCSAASPSRRRRSAQIGGGSHDIHIGVFRNFMAKYNKSYANEAEMKKRYHIFRANMIKIRSLQETEQGTAKYGATQFADLTAKEFKQHHLGLKPSLHMENAVPMSMAKIPEVQLPLEFDWRHYNVVTPVKNQGMCGSCWAFSVTGNIEGQWAIHKQKLLSLSEQELVDCDTLDDGCEGGLPDNAYRAIEKLGGLETESDYPYDGADEKCHFNKSEVKVTIQGAVNISSNETKMAQWLMKNGPISIGINANAMQFYLGGVSHPWKFLCDPENLDHGVLIVGFGVHKTRFQHKMLPYWIIKNSWGTYWGEQGYYRVYRGDGTCGVNMMASSAIVA